MKPTREQCLAWAREAGTPYVNRHYPGITSFGFTEKTLEALVLRAYAEGQKDMRERAASELETGIFGHGECAEEVRKLKIEGDPHA